MYSQRHRWLKAEVYDRTIMRAPSTIRNIQRIVWISLKRLGGKYKKHKKDSVLLRNMLTFLTAIVLSYKYSLSEAV